MLVVNVPIEPLEERYSADWNRWMSKYIVDNKIDYIRSYFPTPLRKEIKEGDFLDVVSTTKYKADQIDMVCREVDKGIIPRDEKVVFLIQDGWFPIEQLAYLRDMLGCRYWKFVGIFHAGTYSKWDLTARSHMYTWGEDLENSWFKIYDKVIVGSRHHKQVLLEKRKIAADRIHVIPWQVEVPKLDISQKENIVVFPHRLGVEKQPELFYKIADELRNPGWKWIMTADECKTKAEYYELLAKSRIAVSLGLEEFFGIAMVEATLLGCVPLVPDAFAYKEMYKPEFRYKDIKDLKQDLKYWMESDRLKTDKIFNAFYKEYIDEDFFAQVFALMEKL